MAVPPAPTGCPQPCSPTLACWSFWEVSATVCPPPRCPRSERRELAIGPLRVPGDFYKGLCTGSVMLCPARSSPGSLGGHLPHLQPPPGRCWRPRHRAQGAAPLRTASPEGPDLQTLGVAPWAELQGGWDLQGDQEGPRPTENPMARYTWQVAQTGAAESVLAP